MAVHWSPFKKPAHGQSCNGCGYCCAVQPCEIAQEFLKADDFGVCPALERDAATGGTACGLMVRPVHYLINHFAAIGRFGSAEHAQVERVLAQQVAAALGAGKGCDADDDADAHAWPWPIMLSERSGERT